jgi:hypothetical protein
MIISNLGTDSGYCLSVTFFSPLPAASGPGSSCRRRRQSAGLDILGPATRIPAASVTVRVAGISSAGWLNDEPKEFKPRPGILSIFYTTYVPLRQYVFRSDIPLRAKAQLPSCLQGAGRGHRYVRTFPKLCTAGLSNLYLFWRSDIPLRTEAQQARASLCGPRSQYR